MISINIPVYNIEVHALVLQLIKQAEKLKISFEIRVYDDGSDNFFKDSNRKLVELQNVVYKEMESNLGRASIRNKMGLESKFRLILFIDADSEIVNEKYLEMYLKEHKPNCVLCGGTLYDKDKPAEKEKLLRWIYGTKREAISAKKRNLKKGFVITSNNFLIDKSVFEEIHFRGNLKNYGHEDTLLGYDLFRKNIEILHIENPVKHTGLEDAGLFLYKTKTALKNLYFISNHYIDESELFIKQINFLNLFSKITKYPLLQLLLKAFYRLSERFLEKNLKGNRPDLLLFDLYKLGYYLTLKK